MAEMRLVNLHKRYGGTAAVRGISATIADGELLALLGPSGCGKTTTLQLLAGFLAPDEGEIWVNDRQISSPRSVVPPERRNMAMVFQGYALWPHMTVAQNVAFGLEVRRTAPDEIRRRVEGALDVVGLGGFGRRYPHELSGGQQQRVALARALVVRPDTLLLDEPLSNLDASLREQMRFEIRRIHQETGITTVYVTHDQTEAIVIADRIAVLNAGRIEQIGSPREIYDTPRSPFVAAFIGQSNCLPGQLLEPGVVRCGDIVIRTDPAAGGPQAGQAEPAGDAEHGRETGGSGEIRRGDSVVLCIRPTALRILPAGDADAPDAPGPGDSLITGTPVQQAYLGDLQDLRIDLAGGLQVRALAPADQHVPVGQPVRVRFPRNACRLVRA